MDRIQYIDLLKGIAIFLVVIGHVLNFSFGIHHSSVLSMLVLFHMPLFFYTSGFLSYRDLSDTKLVFHRIIRKYRRLLLPWIIVSFAMHTFSGMGLFITIFSFYWFFYVLILLSTAFILYEYFVARHIKNIFLNFSLWMVIPLVLGGMKFLFKCDDTWIPFNSIIMYFFSYLLGWNSRKYRVLNDTLLHNHVLYLGGLLTFLYCWYNSENLNILVRIVGGLGAIIVLQAFLYNRVLHGLQGKLSMLLGFLGKSSLVIYMFNNFFIPDLKNIMVAKYIIVPNGFLCELVLSTIIAIPIVMACLLVEFFLKQNKYLDQII